MDSQRLRDPRLVTLALGLVALAYVGLHVAAVFSEGANWDEYALLARAEKVARTGVLDGGGRPGLGVALLVPIVDGCTSTTTVLLTARIVWVGFTLGLLAGVFVFLWVAVRRSPRAMHAAALGTAMIALVPVFMRWALQVRTDQPSVMFALWGGVAVFASRRRWFVAAIGGALCGTGYLFSQKAVYVTSLVVVVVAADVWLEGSFAWRRELGRVLWFGAGVAVALVTYHLAVPMLAPPPSAGSLEHGLDQFRWYRTVVGYRVYLGMLHTLWPQLVMLAAVTFALARASRTRSPQLRVLGIAMIVALLGVAVGAFHAAAFPYFWITLGLFPAVAIGLGWSAVPEVVPRMSLAAGVVGCCLLAGTALPYRFETLEDTQRVQRESLAFVDWLPASLRGFHPDGALVCRRDPDPVPAFLRETVVRRFSGPDRERKAAAFVADLRARPTAFIVRTHRMVQFPPAVQKFWTDSYVPYRGTVAIAGRRLQGGAGSRHVVDVVVPGTYRWSPQSGGAARIRIGGRALDRGQTVELGPGQVAIDLVDPTDGILALDVGVPPAPPSVPEAFYDARPLMEIGGTRRQW